MRMAEVQGAAVAAHGREGKDLETPVCGLAAGHVVDLRKIPLTAILVAFGAVVAVFGVLALFNLPTFLDEYDWYMRVRQKGFWGGQVWFYLKWSGRFASTVLLCLHGVFIQFRPNPAVAIGVIVCLWIALRRFISSALAAVFGRRVAAAAATVFLSLYLATMPSCLETIYWVPLALTYELGMILALWLMALLIDPMTGAPVDGSRKRGFGIFLLAFLTVGFSETIMLVLLAALGAGAVLRLAVTRRMPRDWCQALVGAAVGAAIVVGAPGNASRQAGHPVPHDLAYTLLTTVQHVWWYSHLWLTPQVIAASLLAFLTALLCVRPSLARWKAGIALLAVGISGPVLMGVTLFPSFWATGDAVMPARIQNGAYMLFLLTALACSFLLGYALAPGVFPAPLHRGRSAALATAIFVVAVLVATGRNTRQALTDLRLDAIPYVREWEQREAFIRAAVTDGRQEVEVPPIAHRPRLLWMMDVRDREGAWENEGYAYFCNAGAIWTSPPDAFAGWIEAGGATVSAASVDVVIPVFNDWGCLPVLVAELEVAFARLQRPAVVHLIDDHSLPLPSDLKERFDKGACRWIRRIEHVRLARNVGHQSAIAAALCMLAQRGNVDCVVILDGDGEDAPSDIPTLVEAMDRETEPHVVFAGRKSRQASRLFRSLYRVYRGLQFALTGHRIEFGNFSVVPGRYLNALTLYEELWHHYPGTVILTRIPYRVVPCDRRPRIQGESRMSLVSLIVHGLQSMSLFSQAIAARMLLTCGVLMLLPIAALTTVIAIRLLTTLAIPGWATYTTGILLIMLLLLVGTSFLFAFMVLSGQRSPAPCARAAYRDLIESIESVMDAGSAG